MAEAKPFICLRCRHQFLVADYQRGQVAERSCPRCGSNSVRLDSAQPVSRTAPPDRQRRTAQ